MLPDFEPFDPHAVAAEYLGLAERLRPFVRDSTTWLHQALANGKRLLFEGAQGSLLDVDHGSYPYVTSSNSSAAGIAAGSGVPTRHIDRWIGIVKAYTTRVGGGPFPTEQDNAVGERIRKVGKEYGTVTGRPRRCGWFDAVAVRYSARVSGSTEICVMLLDVLSGLEELNVAVAYEDDQGRTVAEMPGQLADLERCRPVYETLSGWTEDLTGLRHWSDLPARARDYVRFLGKQIGVPVSTVSVGPERRQTITVPPAD
jgi:adenylosuccinate synthase